jgi:hypothetical protein
MCSFFVKGQFCRNNLLLLNFNGQKRRISTFSLLDADESRKKPIESFLQSKALPSLMHPRAEIFHHFSPKFIQTQIVTKTNKQKKKSIKAFEEKLRG